MASSYLLSQLPPSGPTSSQEQLLFPNRHRHFRADNTKTTVKHNDLATTGTALTKTFVASDMGKVHILYTAEGTSADAAINIKLPLSQSVIDQWIEIIVLAAGDSNGGMTIAQVDGAGLIHGHVLTTRSDALVQCSEIGGAATKTITVATSTGTIGFAHLKFFSIGGMWISDSVVVISGLDPTTTYCAKFS